MPGGDTDINIVIGMLYFRFIYSCFHCSLCTSDLDILVGEQVVWNLDNKGSGLKTINDIILFDDSRCTSSVVYAFCTNGWRRPQTEARFIEQLSTGKLGSWSRTLEHFPPFTLELVENIQRLSVPPNASGNQGYELFHGAHPTISKVCW